MFASVCAEYDTWQQGNVLGPNPTPADIQTLGNNITALIHSNLLANPIHGVFLGTHIVVFVSLTVWCLSLG